MSPLTIVGTIPTSSRAAYRQKRCNGHLRNWIPGADLAQKTVSNLHDLWACWLMKKPLQHPSHFGMRIAAVYLPGTNYSIFVIFQSSFTRWVKPLFSSLSGIDVVQMISTFSPKAVIVSPRRSLYPSKFSSQIRSPIFRREPSAFSNPPLEFGIESAMLLTPSEPMVR